MKDETISEATGTVRRSIVVVRPHVMQAMALIMSNETTRYYLNGIFIQPHKDGGIVLVATDGHILTMVHDRDGFAAGEARIWRFREFAAIIKAKLNAAPKGLKSSARLRYEHIGPRQAEGDFQVAIAFAATEEVPELPWGSSLCEPIGFNAMIDGTFPDYARVIPRRSDQRSGININARLFSVMGKFAQELTQSAAPAINIEPTEEDGPATFRVENQAEGLDAIGVVMPIRNARMLYHPDWVVTHTGRTDLGAPEPIPMEIDRSTSEDAPDQAAQAA